MRNRAVLFGLFFIGYSSCVFHATPTRASLVENPDVESTHVEQWDSNGKRLLQVDGPKRILAEERGMSEGILPAAEAVEKTKVSEKAVPRASLGSKLNPMTWPKRILHKLKLWYARFLHWLLRKATVDEKTIDRSMMNGLTPSNLKRVKNDILHYSSSVPHDKIEIETDYDSYVEHFFGQFKGLDKDPPVFEMDKWNNLEKEMTKAEGYLKRRALNTVSRNIDKGLSNEQLISLDVSPFVYMRLLEKRGVFKDVENNKDKIDQLKDYIKAYKEHLMVEQ
uniref:Secreted RxLR effector protein 151 n=1 Tax=Plasmopara viticola TaxID=143451 RepID=RL151_PLAVT|nr:RecName: Full=Secreted RxLR effector protein 151; Flags: Precursor [Plasmopara viticola]